GTCGNGIVEPGEACDKQSTPSCSADCTSTQVCGNGIKDSGEVCDDNGDRAGAYCDATCQTSTRCDIPAGGSLATLCDDQNECTAPTCDLQLGCVTVAVSDGTSCGSGLGTCRSGGCVVPQVAAGVNNSCSISAVGKLTCWGENTEIRTEAPVSGVFTSVWIGGSTAACGTTAPDNRLFCWGSPTWTDQAPTTALTASALQPGGSGSYSGGSQHGCLVRKDTKALQCWGTNNSSGQLNIASSQSGQYLSVATTLFSSCAARAGGGIECWGSSGDFTNTPAATSAAGAFTKMVAGDSHYCCRKDTG